MYKQNASAVLALAAAGVTIFMVIALVWFGQAGAEPESASQADVGSVAVEQAGEAARVAQQGYPPPVPPTPAPEPTPVPDEGGFFPAPEGIQVEWTTLGDSPYADLLVPLQQALDADLPSAADWVPVAGGVPGVSLGPLLSVESRGKLVSRSDASSILEAYDSAGSSPVIQGYFENTETTKGDVVPATLWVLVTGWQGQVPFPTLEPPVGDDPHPWQPVPSDVGAETSVLGFCCPGEWRWFMWATGGYYDLVNHISTETNDAVQAPLGTYHVVRP